MAGREPGGWGSVPSSAHCFEGAKKAAEWDLKTEALPQVVAAGEEVAA